MTTTDPQASGSSAVAGPAATPAGRYRRVPPHSYFLVSAVFHYLGPAFAVLLFARVDVLGVAWLRIASAAAVFALWRRPWRHWPRLDPATRLLLLSWGAVLAVMNSCFYVAIDRLPLLRDASRLQNLTLEDEVFEAEVLFASGPRRVYVRALAVCDRGSQLLAVVAPNPEARGLPMPQGTPPANLPTPVPTGG